MSTIFNLDAIYNESYSYQLPKPVLKAFINGKAFDHPEFYTFEESEKVRADIEDIFKTVFNKETVSQRPEAVMTAGAPGAGKTTLLRQTIEQAPEEPKFPYICPDDICLKSQKRTYLADIEQAQDSASLRRNAYTKWRPASNGATHLILAHLIKEKIPFYFGTTSSSDKTGQFFAFLKSQKYTIRVIHVSALNDVRFASIQKRDKTFIQTTEKDTYEKGLLVPQRINDAYLKYADVIDFYYRPNVDANAIHAATWVREDGIQGSLKVTNEKAYTQVKDVHNKAIAVLKRPDLAWEKTVENPEVSKVESMTSFSR